MKLRHGLTALAFSASGAALAETPPLVCYGNEPSWSLDVTGGSALFKAEGEEEVDLAGSSTAIAPLKVQAWRGRPRNSRSGDLVAFLTEAPCSDGMSEQKRPYSARVSLPDGRLLAGCCRPDTMRASSASASGGVAAPALGSQTRPEAESPQKEKAPRDWADSIADYLPALRWCTYESLRTEAVLFAEPLPKDRFHLVLRGAGRRYADCETTNSGPARVTSRKKGGKLSPAEEVAVLTLLPGEPPRGACDRSEPALDDRGNPFGWITRKGC